MLRCHSPPVHMRRCLRPRKSCAATSRKYCGQSPTQTSRKFRENSRVFAHIVPLHRAILQLTTYRRYANKHKMGALFLQSISTSRRRHWESMIWVYPTSAKRRDISCPLSPSCPCSTNHYTPSTPTTTNPAQLFVPMKATPSMLFETIGSSTPHDALCGSTDWVNTMQPLMTMKNQCFPATTTSSHSTKPTDSIPTNRAATFYAAASLSGRNAFTSTSSVQQSRVHLFPIMRPHHVSPSQRTTVSLTIPNQLTKHRRNA